MPRTPVGGMRRLAVAFPRWAIDYATSGWVHFLEPFFPDVPPELTHGRDDRPEIVLIPGVYQTWVELSWIATGLHRLGYRINAVPSLGHNRQPIDVSADIVRRELAARGIGDCYIVAHSKGGLIGKRALIDNIREAQENDATWEFDEVDEANPRPRILGMTAISTPFHGSSYADFMPSASLRQFQPTDPIIAELDEDTSVNRRIVSIFGRFDPHIPESSHLEGAAANIEVPVVGHMQILRDTLSVAVTVQAVHHAIRAIRVDAEGSPDVSNRLVKPPIF